MRAPKGCCWAPADSSSYTCTGRRRETRIRKSKRRQVPKAVDLSSLTGVSLPKRREQAIHILLVVEDGRRNAHLVPETHSYVNTSLGQLLHRLCRIFRNKTTDRALVGFGSYGRITNGRQFLLQTIRQR